MLQNLPVKRFIIGFCTSKRQLRILSDIISLVHNPGAKIICEGVESAEQTKWLNETNCDMIQSFYYSEILPSVECKKILKPCKICKAPVFGKRYPTRRRFVGVLTFASL